MFSEVEAESQLNEISHQLADIAQMKKTYEAELASIPPSCSTAEIAATIKLNLEKGNSTTVEKRAAVRAVLDRVIVERVDNTRGRGSLPEINVRLKLKQRGLK